MYKFLNMGKFISFLLIALSLSLIHTSHQLQSSEDGFISVTVSNRGLDFARDLLVKEAVSSMLPLELSDIEKQVKIPLVGSVRIVLSSITIDSLDIVSSTLKTAEKGLEFVASGATASLSMNWKYSYSAPLVPIKISDSGVAFVQVEGMDMEFTAGLKLQDGSLQLSALDCWCQVKGISIELDGGQSWLYEGVVAAFEGKIKSAIETKVSNKVREGISKLDSLLESLPKEIPIDDIASLNVTFVSDPVLSDSSVEFEVNGLFTKRSGLTASHHHYDQPLASVSCTAKMLTISLHEDVFNSASVVLFDADRYWIVDQMPDQSHLNTADWKQIIPQLYHLYPDAAMNLNISVSSPPVIKIGEHDISTTLYSVVTINVLDGPAVIPVASVSVEVSASASAEIIKNNLSGNIMVNDLIMILNWSKVGEVDIHLLRAATSTLLKTVLLPYVNMHLMRGYPLPHISSIALKKADILFTSSTMIICTNLVLTY